MYYVYIVVIHNTELYIIIISYGEMFQFKLHEAHMCGSLRH